MKSLAKDKYMCYNAEDSNRPSGLFLKSPLFFMPL